MFFLRKYWFLILLTIITLAFVSIFILTQKQNSKPAAPSTKNIQIDRRSLRFSESIRSGKYQINISPLKIPQKMMVFSVANFSDQNLHNVFLNTTSVLNINTSTPPTLKTEKLLEWIQPSAITTLTLPSGAFSVVGNIKVAPAFSSTSAKDYAESESVRLGMVRKIDSSKTRSFKSYGNELEETKNIQDADVFSVSIIPSINGYPVARIGQNQASVEFKLSKNGELLVLSYRGPIIGNVVGFYKTKSWSEILSEINANKAKTLWVEDSKSGVTEYLENAIIQSVAVEKAYLAYMLLPTTGGQKLLQPVIVFQGNGFLSSGEQKVLAFFLPISQGVSF